MIGINCKKYETSVLNGESGTYDSIEMVYGYRSGEQIRTLDEVLDQAFLDAGAINDTENPKKMLRDYLMIRGFVE